MLKGHNVYLRLLEKKDIRILYKLCNEDKVRKYNTIPNNNQGMNLRKALSIINEKNVLIGFMSYKKSNDYNNVYSIGITIGSQYWGRGYGQDCVRTLIKYLFGELNAIKVELEVIKDNLRAISCYRKCGFIEEGIIRNKVYIEGENVDTIIMGIFREQVVDI